MAYELLLSYHAVVCLGSMQAGVPGKGLGADWQARAGAGGYARHRLVRGMTGSSSYM